MSDRGMSVDVAATLVEQTPGLYMDEREQAMAVLFGRVVCCACNQSAVAMVRLHWYAPHMMDRDPSEDRYMRRFYCATHANEWVWAGYPTCVEVRVASPQGEQG